MLYYEREAWVAALRSLLGLEPEIVVAGHTKQNMPNTRAALEYTRDYLLRFETAIMALDGVENVCLNRFKRLGSQYADQSTTGVIPFEGLEIAVCDNDPRRPDRGYYRLDLHGGRLG